MSLRIRFRLGSLLWIVALLAIVLGWWSDRQQLEVRHLKEERDLLVKLHQNAVLLDESLEKQHQLVVLLSAADKPAQ